mmetsp:Transcript_4199/g.5697  ORF Transcript_4199/g.5697 Transcript_4199/m.5697 type:complete len:675 (-) Transcript_4199:151-2175(-)|eukprot:jgi/Bigna1/91917/estExt_fgenesh1_pg.C_1300007
MNGVFNNEKLNLSEDEKRRLYNCMKKKEFHDLLHDYMRDLNDPKTRKEQDMYVRQLEGNNQLPPGLKILRPKPQFCVEVTTLDTKETIFVNVCSSKYIDRATPSTVEQNGVMGTSWRIPYSMGPNSRSCLNEKKQSSLVYDVIFNSKDMPSFKADGRMQDLMIKTALEGVSRVMKEKLNVPEYCVLDGVKCKGGEPPSLSFRDPEAAKSTKDIPRDPLIPTYEPNTTSSKKILPPSIPQSGFLKETTDATSVSRIPPVKKQQNRSKIQTTPKNEEGCKDRSTDSSFSVGDVVVIKQLRKKPEYNGREGVIKSKLCSRGRHRVMLTSSGSDSTGSCVVPLTVINVRPTNLVISGSSNQKGNSDAERKRNVPDYVIVERGSQLGNNILQFGSERHEVIGSRRPSELVVKIRIPAVTDLKLVDLDMQEKHLSLNAPPYDALSVDLPYKVEHERGSAKYKRKKQILLVTLPVKKLSPQEVEDALKSQKHSNSKISQASMCSIRKPVVLGESVDTRKGPEGDMKRRTTDEKSETHSSCALIDPMARKQKAEPKIVKPDEKAETMETMTEHPKVNVDDILVLDEADGEVHQAIDTFIEPVTDSAKSPKVVEIIKDASQEEKPRQNTCSKSEEHSSSHEDVQSEESYFHVDTIPMSMNFKSENNLKSADEGSLDDLILGLD